MSTKTTAQSLALALALLGGAGAAIAQQAMTEPQIHDKLAAQGYTRVHDLEFKHGMWRAEARSADGKRVDLRIDAATGQVYPDKQVSQLGKADVEAALETQGYTDVHDVEFKQGLWTAEAKNPAGHHVKLSVDAASGKVIGTQ